MRQDEPTHAELLERARAIAGHARDRSAQTNAERRVPQETMDELWDAGLMRVCQLPEHGGLGRSWSEFYELVHTLATGCGSTAWVYVVLAGHSRSMAEFTPEAVNDVWGKDSSVLVSSAFNPSGMAKPVEGGWRLSGRYSFSSGSDFAQWATVGALTPIEGGMMPKLFLIPYADTTIVDDWHVLGLAGTGSKTLVAEDIFVPAHRVNPFPVLDGAIFPFSLQAVIVGAALGGVEAFIAETKTKPGKMGLPPPAQSDLVQAAVGESWGEVHAAWRLLKDAASTTEEAHDGVSPVPEWLRLQNRATNGVVSRLAMNAIERVYSLSGGNGVYNSAVSRAFLDVRAGVQHMVTNWNNAGRAAGALLLK